MRTPPTALTNTSCFQDRKSPRTYRPKREVVAIINYDAANAIKITIPRPTISGDIDDNDVFGGQQYGPLVDLEVP